MAVGRALRLWNGTFRLERLTVLAEAADMSEEQAGRSVLRLYARGQCKMSRVAVEELLVKLKRAFPAAENLTADP
jgi:hypothetical protein